VVVRCREPVAPFGQAGHCRSLVLSWTLRASAAASPCGERACFECGEHSPPKAIERATTEDRFGSARAPSCRAHAEAVAWQVPGAQSRSAPRHVDLDGPG
jgi:hypothetical protein